MLYASFSIASGALRLIVARSFSILARTAGGKLSMYSSITVVLFRRVESATGMPPVARVRAQRGPSEPGVDHAHAADDRPAIPGQGRSDPCGKKSCRNDQANTDDE